MLSRRYNQPNHTSILLFSGQGSRFPEHAADSRMPISRAVHRPSRAEPFSLFRCRPEAVRVALLRSKPSFPRRLRASTPELGWTRHQHGGLVRHVPSTRSPTLPPLGFQESVKFPGVASWESNPVEISEARCGRFLAKKMMSVCIMAWGPHRVVRE